MVIAIIIAMTGVRIYFINVTTFFGFDLSSFFPTFFGFDLSSFTTESIVLHI